MRKNVNRKPSRPLDGINHRILREKEKSHQNESISEQKSNDVIKQKRRGRPSKENA